MSFFKLKNISLQNRWALIFFIGFLTGIGLVCLMPQTTVWNSELLSKESFYKIHQLQIDKHAFFLYSLKKRFTIVWFTVLASAVGAWEIVNLGVPFCGGMSFGIYLTVLSVRYGIKGLFAFAGCMLPQQLILFPGFVMLLYWGQKRMQKRKLLLPAATITVGCILESYVNPYLLKIVLKLFIF